MTELERAAIRKYRKQGLGYKKVAKKMGIPLDTVKSFCRSKSFTAPTTCLQCKKKITQTKGRKMKKFCSDKCRMRSLRMFFYGMYHSGPGNRVLKPHQKGIYQTEYSDVFVMF